MASVGILGAGLALGLGLTLGSGNAGSTGPTAASALPSWVQSAVANQVNDLAVVKTVSSSTPGGASGETLSFTETTESAYWSANGQPLNASTSAANPTIWFVVVTGTAEYQDATALYPSSAQPPSGNTLEFTFDTATQDLINYGVIPDGNPTPVSILSDPNLSWSSYTLASSS